MLDKKAVSSYYRDPYLTAIRKQSGVARAAVRGTVQHGSGDPGFTGYETEARWMQLVKSGTDMMMLLDGLLLRPPAATHHAETCSRVCHDYGIGADFRLRVPQISVGGRPLDTKDRVQLGAALLRDLVGAGL
jgi:hypothetical protein